MATDIKRAKYLTDSYGDDGKPDAEGDPIIVFVEMDGSSIDADKAGAEPAGTPTVDFTLNSFQNKGKFGLHPRYVELAREITGSGGSSCLIQKGEIPRKLVILTPTRFTALKVRGQGTTGEDLTGTQITLDTVNWRVVRKLPERRNNVYNSIIIGRFKV